MIRNYFMIAYRHFIKDSLYSLINIVGLAIGITCSILILLYVSDELSYDRHHSNAERIYRVNEFFDSEDGSSEHSSSLPFPMGEQIKMDNPGIVEEVVRFFNFQAPFLTLAYEPADKEFNERHVFFVDSTYHHVFDLSLIKGDPAKALSEPNSMIITESAVAKYFENEDPIGKLLRLQGQTDLMITGVMKDMPSGSHFRADFLISFSTLRQFYGGQLPANWYWNPCWTYLLLTNPGQAPLLEASFPEFTNKHLPDFFKNDATLKLQALTDIHLTSHLDFEIQPNSSEANIYLFSCIAIFVLLIACINFMNLSTARSVNRAKEVALRKTVGGNKLQLVFQFLFESLVMSFVAVALAIILVNISLPFFNVFAEKELTLDLTTPRIIIGLFSIGLIVGIFSGIYPALVLTSFNPVKALKLKNEQTRGLTFRKVLVVTQFAISIILIISTGVTIRQLDFLQSSDPGFTKEHIVMVPVIRTPIGRQYEAFKEEALRYNGIHSITAVEEVLGSKHQGANYQFEGMEVSSLFSRLNVRHDFLRTFNIPLLAGRDYSRDVHVDDSLSLVVNESLIRTFGWTPDQAIGKPFTFGRFQGQIIGVTKDFNFTSKHQPVGPLVLHLNTFPGAFNLFLKYMAVRINPAQTQESILALEKVWKEMIPGRPFEYFFLDNELNNLYKAEANLGKIATSFSALAILVACLGLFGLASFNAEQRKKEIGIRKALGSSVPEIIALMFSGYTRLLLIAIVIACPVAYFALDYWLTTFAYRIPMPLTIFVIASFVTAFIALLTVSYQSFKAARTNPVEALKYE